MADSGEGKSDCEFISSVTPDRRQFLATVVGGSTVALAGCSDSSGATNTSDSGATGSGDQVEIAVGSKNFTEQNILGYMLLEVLDKNTSVATVDEINYGNTAETWEGLKDRAFHTYWDYLGTIWFVHPPQHDTAIDDLQEQYDAVVSETEAEHELELLEMAPFENTYTLVAEPETIAETGIETISDLAAYVNAGNYDLRIAFGYDFYDRPDGWPGLTDHYGFEDQALREWEANDGIVRVSPGIGFDEVDSGNADIALGYSTQAKISAYGLVSIEDDRNFWPHYNPVPLLAEEKATGAVTSEINRLPPAIESAQTMQDLNARVDIDGQDPQRVARRFLREERII